MELKLDQEFATALGPFMQAQQSVERPRLHNIEARRAGYAAFGAPAPLIPNSVVFEVLKTSQDGKEVPVHHFRRRDQQAHTPAVIHFHGGGFISLTPDINTERLASLVDQVNVQVFSVDYRLAPEHPYPAALDDGWATLTWIRESAMRLGIDTRRIVVMGEELSPLVECALLIGFQASPREVALPQLWQSAHEILTSLHP